MTPVSFTANIETSPAGKLQVVVTLFDRDGEEIETIRYDGYADYDEAEADLRIRRRDLKLEKLSENLTDY